MKRVFPFMLSAALAGATMYAIADDDRPPTGDERARIVQTLEGMGYKSVGEIEIEGNRIEVEDALHSDGKRYELKLDAATLKVLKRELDDD
ncbi:MAG: PepSY domain-containing protein [Betaproteobacteria bacterium]